MATLSNSQRLKEARKKREEESKNSSSQSASRNYRNSEKLEMRKLERNIGLDTFESDLTSLGSTVQSIYSDWHDPDTLNNTKSSVESMMKRINDFQTYQSKYGSADASNISEIASGYQSVLDDWDKLSEAYGYYQNADAFNAARKKAQFDEQFSGLSYDDVQKMKKEYEEDSDEYKYLSEYMNYSDLRDFDKALTDAKTNVNITRDAITPGKKNSKFDVIEKAKKNAVVTNGSAIAYNKDAKESSQSDYLRNLETLRNQYALDHKFDLYRDYMEAEDFEDTSQYISTKKDGFGVRLTSQYGMGYEDLTYEYVNNVDGIRDEIKSKARAFGADNNDGVSSMEKKGYDKLNAEEVAVYNSIYQKEGKDKAQEFLDDMEIVLTKRVYDEATQRWEDIADSGPVASTLMSALSVPMNIFGTFTGAVDTVGDAIQGKEYNPYGYYKMPTNYSADTRKYVGENIAEETEGFEIFGQNIPSFLYQTGMSVADSAVGATMFGSGFSVVMGTSAAQQRAKELKEAGASPEEIARGSVASGIVEMLWEKVSLDNLISMKNSDSLLGVVKNTLKQAGIEGSEEFATEVSNVLFDTASRGKNSDAYKMYEEYLARGFSEEEAEKMVKQDINSQIAWAFVGGAISGTALGGSSSVVQHHDLSNTGKAIRSNDRVDEMIGMYDTMELQGLTPDQSEALRTYAKYAQKGVNADTINNAQLGNLYRTSEREAIETIKSKKSTDTQKSDAMKRLDSLDVIATSKPIDEIARQRRVESLNKGEVTEVTATGNSTKIEGIRIDNGDTIVLTSEGEVKAEDMTFSYNDAEIVSYAENMSQEKANLLLSQYDGKADADSFVKSFNLAYAYGETGFGAESVLKNKGVLSESQASEIYKNAVLNRASEQQKAIDEINAKHGKTTVLKGKFNDSIIDYSGKSKDGNKVNWKKLESRQRSAIVFAKAFSQATGVNIRLVQSKVVDGKRVGKNGSYNQKTNTIDIDVYAGIIDVKAVEDSIIPTLSHEMTHWMKAKAPTMYSKMTEYISETLVADGRTTMDKLVNDEMARMQTAHPNMNVTAEMAIDEIVARASEDMLSNSDTARKLLNRMGENEKQSFINKVKETFKNLISWANDLLSQYKSESQEAKVLRQYKERLKALSKMWDKALEESIQTNQSLQKEGITGEEAINAITEKVGITVDMESESAAPAEQLSERTWTQSEYVQNRKVAISNLSKALGVSEKKAAKYVDSINSVARLIADDRARLDYDSNIDENASVVKPNSDYKWSVDMSTLCAKRLLFTGTFDEIQKRLPNTALDSDDIVKIRKMMMDKGYQVACGICYVESTRREIGTITKDFVERYKIAQKTGKPIARVNSSGKEVDLVETGTKAKFYAEKGYTPTLAELNTTDIDLVKRDHPSVYGAYLSFMNARGQAKPKLLETRAEYKGEIASKFKRKKNGELNSSTISMNDFGGLRLQSFSDFEVAHLIDMMQVVMDMSEVGLTSQAYTKVPEFAEVFGDTGVKINLSLIAKGSGLDENGELIFDDVEGIDHKKAFALREKFSKNVGTILVGKNDAHIIKAMADSRIDYIIPFHKSSWRESLYDALGLTGYDDYTDTQHEKSIDPNRKIKDFMPSEYWDYSKSGDENAQIYLEKCKADGRIPKFPQFAQYDGYWKLLIDFKMYDNNGVGSPQTQVMPNFDMESANRILNEYEGGHRSFPVAKDIVDEFVADYKKGHLMEQYSDRVSKDENYIANGKNYGNALEYLNDKLVNGVEGKDYITVYRSFQVINGGLYAPMNAVDRDDDGKNHRLGFRSKIGVIEKATESPTIAQDYMDKHPNAPYAKFNLDGVDNATSGVAYNPYLHASNLVMNDQFSAAYRRNLVTVECRVPISEIGAYKAQYAKDATGWVEWKPGGTSLKLAKAKPQYTRKLFVSRYMLPYRILDYSEVANIYKEYLEGTDIEVPWNVVGSDLREALVDVGVGIDYKDYVVKNKSYGDKVYRYDEHKDDSHLDLSTIEGFWENDTQYSDRDSEGTQLTKNQTEFFKDSKVRDENGRLKVMYHGTERGGFTVFNKDFSDDGRSLFFTDSPMVAKGYSGTYDEIIPGKKLSVDEMTDIINDSYLWVEYDNGEYQIVRNKYGEFKVEYSNKDYDEFVEYLNEEYGSNEPSGNYKVYMNLKNPLVVEAQGRNWDDLPISQTKNVNRYNYIYITKGANGKYNVEWEDMMNKYGDAETAELTFAEIKSKFGEYVADEIKHGRASIDNIIIDSRNKELIPRTTRQYSYYAEKHGYDGVIIEDVLDIAIYASGKEKYQTSTVAIAFNPNQIKSVANTNPTEDMDMRYSDRDSEGSKLSNGQVEYFINSKVRDENGNLLKMYHGTFADFTTFDIEKTSEDAYYGRGFYFTSDESDAKKTYADASGVDTQVKIDEEASWLLDSWGYAFDDIPSEYNHKLYTIDKHGYWNPVSEGKAFNLYKKAVNQVAKEKYSNGRVIPVYLDVQNPYIVEEGNLDNPIKIEQEARRLGRDGIIDYSVAKRFNLKKGTVHVVAFSPSQVKLTTNENPTNNFDIRYSDRTLTRAEANQLARQKVASYKEQMEKKAKIESITQKALVLNKWMLKNSKDEHIPEAMKPVVAHLLKAIDFSSKQYLGMRGGKLKGMPTRTDLSLAQALADVQQMMTKAEVDGDVLFELYGADLDEDMDALVKAVNLYMRTVGDNEFVLNQMTLDELHRFDKIVGAIKSSVSKMNRFHVANTTKSIAAITKQDISYMNSLGKAKLHKGKWRSDISQMLNWGNATPYYAFKRFGEGGQKVFEALQDGWDKFAFHIKKIIDYTEVTYSDEDVKKWSEEVHEFDVLMPATEKELDDPNFKGNYKKIQMTTAQIMSLYCLQKREQAKKHLRGGGIRIANFTTKDGVVEQAEGVVLQDKEVDKIINVLTIDQIAVANALQKFMNEDCVEWGNEITMKRFGYKAFGEENYFPIKSDDNVTGTGEVKEKEKSLYRLLNLSFTKSLVKEANNRIVVDSIFDVFAQHTSEMAKYNALALPVLDAVRWFNFKEKGKKVDTHFETRSLKAAMESAFGKDANNYVATFLQDINGADNVGRDRIAKGFMKNAKIASVGFNAKVVALQPTSYLRASAIIDNKYLVKAFGRKPKIAMAEKWCGMAQWKALGFIDINVQRGVAELIKHDKTAMDTMTDWAMKGAEIADKVTLGYLWNACEAEVKDKRPDLTVGTDAYYKAIGKRLRDIIYSSQVVDSTMTRSQMMRSTDGWDKVLTNFASEPTVSYNMLMDAYYDYKLTERETGSRSKAFDKHGKKLRKTMYAYAVTSAVTALLELGFEIFRDDEELSPEEMMKMYLENIYLNMSIVNKIPYAKEAISILQGFTSNRMDTQWMQYFSYAAKGWVKLFSGEGNAYKTLQNTIKGFSYVFGVPIQNLTRDINALMDKLGILTSDELEEMFNETIGEAFPSLKTK